MLTARTGSRSSGGTTVDQLLRDVVGTGEPRAPPLDTSHSHRFTVSRPQNRNVSTRGVNAAMGCTNAEHGDAEVKSSNPMKNAQGPPQKADSTDPVEVNEFIPLQTPASCIGEPS